MKSIIIALVAIFSMCSIAFAGNVDTIMIPSDCKTIQSSTYSSGGGKKAIVYVKIHCIMKDGSDALFLADKISGSGILGFGRFDLPDRINFVRTDELKDKCLWK